MSPPTILLKSILLKMRCHYDVFELPRTATTEEIKKQYKKLALKYHPDRNHGKEDEAAELFKEVSTAYAVLSNPQERRWYDDHRDAILRGGDGDDAGEEVSEVPNLWPYFSSSCFKGFGDDGKGFYCVFRNLFHDIETTERNSGDINMELMPEFGNCSSTPNDVLKFYAHWTNFASKLSFSWEDKYNPSDAPDRAVRRAIEKDNKVHRDAARKKYNEMVRNLAGHVRILDPRVEAILAQARGKKEQEETLRLNARKEEKERKRQLRERNRQLQQQLPQEDEDELITQKEFRLADDEEEVEVHMSAAAYTDYEGVDVTAAAVGEVDGDVEVLVEYYCEICQKSFKSSAQLAQHINSKVHKKNEQELLKAKRKGSSKNTSGRSSDSVDNQSSKSEAVSEDVGESEIELPGSVNDNGEDNEDSVSVDISAATTTVVDASDNTGGDYDCAICEKSFKSQAQLTQHISSKVHRKKEQELQKAKKKDSGKKGKPETGSDKKVAAGIETMQI